MGAGDCGCLFSISINTASSAKATQSEDSLAALAILSGTCYSFDVVLMLVSCYLATGKGLASLHSFPPQKVRSPSSHSLRRDFIRSISHTSVVHGQ